MSTTPPAPNKSPGSNVEAIVRHSTAYIHSRTADADAAGLTSLTARRQIGATLKIAKEAMSGVRGWFGRWAKDEFGFSKQWTARLMKLDTEWNNFFVAREWAEAEGIFMHGREFSVDGALALIERWRRATDPEYAARKAATDGATDRPTDTTADSQESEVERLQRLLDIERQRNETLERQAAELRASFNGRTIIINDQTKAKAGKVAGLWLRGSTDGERQAAKERLRDMADQLDIGFPSFLRLCGIQPGLGYSVTRAA